MKTYFAHEKLQAYQASLEFARWSEPILERIAKTTAVHNQLDRARTSIVLNIAEGNGKFTAADKCRFFDNSHGSALECAGCLDLLFIKQALSESELDTGKSILSDVVSLLIGLIRSKSLDRFTLKEEPADFHVGERE